MKIWEPVLLASYSLLVQTVLPFDLPSVRYCLPSYSRGGVQKKKCIAMYIIYIMYKKDDLAVQWLQKEGCEKLASAPIDAPDSTPRLNTYTGALKGRGGCWAKLVSPLLTIFPCRRVALCRHNTSGWWGLRKPRLDSHMQGEIYMTFEINQQKEFN